MVDNLIGRLRRPTPVTYLVIAFNIVAFIWLSVQLLTAASPSEVFYRYGIIPARLLNLRTWFSSELPHQLATLLSSMFMHAHPLHLLTNMLFLWAFGRSVELRIGGRNFVMLYLLAGLVSGIGHAIFHPRSTLPLIGASGAVAGILGAYLISFPRAWVLTFIPPLFILGSFGVLMCYLLKVQPPRWLHGLVWLPATFVLLFWFGLQVTYAWQSFFTDARSEVAWWAHVFGFIAGVWFMTKQQGKRHRHYTTNV